MFNRPLFLSAVLFFLVLAFYAAFRFFANPEIERKIVGYEEEKIRLFSKFPEEEQKKLANFYSQLNYLKDLLDGREEISLLLEAVEKNTHKEIVLESLEFNAETKILILSGVAPSQDILSRQVEILRYVKNIKNVSLEKADESKKGVIFKIILSYDP